MFLVCSLCVCVSDSVIISYFQHYRFFVSHILLARRPWVHSTRTASNSSTLSTTASPVSQSRSAFANPWFPSSTSRGHWCVASAAPPQLSAVDSYVSRREQSANNPLEPTCYNPGALYRCPLCLLAPSASQGCNLFCLWRVCGETWLPSLRKYPSFTTLNQHWV